MDEKNIKLFEDFFSLTYDESYEYGSVLGVIHTNIANIEIWFHNHHINTEDIKEYVLIPMAFLNTINIFDNYRDMGYGIQMYDGFEEYCRENGAEAIIVESNEQGFEWYLKMGYQEIHDNSGNKIMYKKIVPYDEVDENDYL